MHDIKRDTTFESDEEESKDVH